MNRSAQANRSVASRFVLNQARRGNPKAIETLAQQDLSRLIEGRGVRVRIERRNATLLVHLTAPMAPQRGTSMAWAKLFFAKLPVVGVSGAQILSHRAGIPEPVWSDRVPLKPVVQGLRLTPMLAGRAFAGVVLLTLLWNLGSMMRRSSKEQLAQSQPQKVAQINATTNNTATNGATTNSATTNSATTNSATAANQTASPQPKESAYKVTREEIFDGQRIQIDTGDPNLGRDECVAIAAQYLEEAGTDGQVVVQKPNPKPPWHGKQAPFCADNNDGEGTFFNDEYF